MRIAALVIVAVVIQTAFGNDLRIMHVAPDLMVVIAVCAGLTGGTLAGAWVGFSVGLLTDMFLTSTPVGLSALTYCLVGAAVGALRATALQETRAMIPIVAFLGTAVAVLFFVGAGDVLGQNQLLTAGRSWLLRVILIESLWSAALVVPVYFIYSRAARGSAGAEELGTPFGFQEKTLGVTR